MSRRGFALAVTASAALLGACLGDDVPTRPVGGTQYGFPLTLQPPVRLPAATFALRFNTGNASPQTPDTITIVASNLKPLEGSARYQFFVVNGVDGSSRPIQANVTTARTDTAFGGGITGTSTVTTTVGQRMFFEGALFNTVTTFRIPRTFGLDSTSAFIVLTIQPDSATASFADSIPKPLFLRFRDQRGTLPVVGDIITLTGSAQFGFFNKPGASRPFVPQGSGRAAFWDRDGQGAFMFAGLLLGLTQPPVGYYYQGYVRDLRTGRFAPLDTVRDATTDTSLFNADLSPVQGTLAQFPDARSKATEALLQYGLGDTVSVRVTDFTAVQYVLEPKQGVKSYPGVTVVLSGIVPPLLSDRRRGGNLLVTVLNQNGTPASGIGVALFGAVSGAPLASPPPTTSLFASATNDQGQIEFTGVPLGDLAVRAFAPTGRTVVSTNPVITSVPSASTFNPVRVTFVLN